tara:strand:- start:362 stop:493 length:132 start_codon:yes stop_codon:yes gene_type:complete
MVKESYIYANVAWKFKNFIEEKWKKILFWWSKIITKQEDRTSE